MRIVRATWATSNILLKREETTRSSRNLWLILMKNRIQTRNRKTHRTGGKVLKQAIRVAFPRRSRRSAIQSVLIHVKKTSSLSLSSGSQMQNLKSRRSWAKEKLQQTRTQMFSSLPFCHLYSSSSAPNSSLKTISWWGLSSFAKLSKSKTPLV